MLFEFLINMLYFKNKFFKTAIFGKLSFCREMLQIWDCDLEIRITIVFVDRWVFFLKF